jgi:molybdate transport system regulatory protein
MKISARNQLGGSVSALRSGAVNDEVELTVAGGGRIVANVTRESSDSLGLRVGAKAFALIKASSIIIGTQTDDIRLSTRNQLAGTVAGVKPGVVNAEVTLSLDGGESIVATITLDSLEALGLAEGSRAKAFFKASSVVLGVFV